MNAKKQLLGKKRKENNIIWSGLRWGILEWKTEDLRNDGNTSKATFPLLFWLSSSTLKRILQFKTLNIACKTDVTIGKKKPKHQEWRRCENQDKNSPRPDLQCPRISIPSDEVQTSKIILETTVWSILLLNKLGAQCQGMSPFA